MFAYGGSGTSSSVLESGTGAPTRPRGSLGTTVDLSGTARQVERASEILAAEESALGRIKELVGQTASRDWDGEGGEPIEPRQWDDARALVSRAVRELLGLPPPFVSACGDGTVHLQWTTPHGDRGIIEIGRDAYWWDYLPAPDRGEQDEVLALSSPDPAFEKVRALFG